MGQGHTQALDHRWHCEPWYRVWSSSQSPWPVLEGLHVKGSDLCFRSTVHDVEKELKGGKAGDEEAGLVADTIVSAEDDGALSYGHDDGTGEHKWGRCSVGGLSWSWQFTSQEGGVW